MPTPSWPSLYDPSIEIINIEHNSPVQVRGAYLYHPRDIFRFTLYWTLIFYCPIFVLCGFYAFWNLNFSPAPRPHSIRTSPESNHSLHERGRDRGDDAHYSPQGTSSYPLSPLTRTSARPPPPPQPPPLSATPPSTSISFPSTMPFHPHTDASPHRSPNRKSSGPASSPPRSTEKPKHNYEEREHRSRFTFALLVLLLFLCGGVAGAVLSSAIVGFAAAAFYRSVDYHMSTWIPFLLAIITVLVGFLSLWPSIIDII
ncbi:hypothetical protein AX15_007430 [Amanita polypyramis BW_CC]|nr:hypothetical protein AX15_007430 [Amanita polypyramis BW_CC]